MNVQTVLSSVTPYDAEHSYADFAKVMDNAYIELSFWGGRNVYAVGYSGSVYLEDLCLKLVALVDSHPEFSQEERVIGISMQNKLEKLYKISEAQEAKANFITSFFMNVTMLFIGTINGDFFYDGVSDYMPFNYCTAKQYKEITGEDPDYKISVGSFRKHDMKGSIRIWNAPTKKNI